LPYPNGQAGRTVGDQIPHVSHRGSVSLHFAVHFHISEAYLSRLQPHESAFLLGMVGGAWSAKPVASGPSQCVRTEEPLAVKTAAHLLFILLGSIFRLLCYDFDNCIYYLLK
jgi:hypothetical protein